MHIFYNAIGEEGHAIYFIKWSDYLNCRCPSHYWQILMVSETVFIWIYSHFLLLVNAFSFNKHSQILDEHKYCASDPWAKSRRLRSLRTITENARRPRHQINLSINAITSKAFLEGWKDIKGEEVFTIDNGEFCWKKHEA